MGYRSDVYLAFHKTLLPFWLAHVQDHMTTIATEADTYNFFDDNSEWCLIIYECVKWYGSYDDVVAIEKAFEYFQEHCNGEQYQYLRVGEEFDDVEMVGYADMFSLDRKVTIH